MDACKDRYDLTFDTARFTYWDATNQVRSATREPTMRIHDPATRITIDVAEVGDKIDYPWIRVLYFFNGGDDVNGFIKVRNTFRAFFDLLVGYSDKIRGVESMVLEAAMNPITGVSTTDDLSRPWRFEKHKSGLNKLQRMWSLTGGVMPFYPEDRRMFWCLPEVLHEMLSHPECPDHLMKNFHPKQSFYSDVLAALREGFKGRLYRYDKKLFRSNSPFHDPNIRKVTDDKQLNYRGKVIDFRSGQITYTNSWCSKDYEKRMKRIADEFNTRHIYDDPFVPVLKHEPLKNYYEAPIVHRGRGSIKGATQFHI